jgi:hypothetical protein
MGRFAECRAEGATEVRLGNFRNPREVRNVEWLSEGAVHRVSSAEHPAIALFYSAHRDPILPGHGQTGLGHPERRIRERTVLVYGRSAAASLSRSDTFQERTGRDTEFLTSGAQFFPLSRAILKAQYLYSHVSAGRGTSIPLQHGVPMFGITAADNFAIPGAHFNARWNALTQTSDVSLRGGAAFLSNAFNVNRYNRVCSVESREIGHRLRFGGRLGLGGIGYYSVMVVYVVIGSCEGAAREPCPIAYRAPWPALAAMEHCDDLQTLAAYTAEEIENH